jgi:outer membrane protein assembly factor BamB
MCTTRRQLLGSVAGGMAAAAVAGGTASAQAAGAWPMDGFDAANSGFNPDASGPHTDVGSRWTFETGARVTASPAVVDGGGSSDGGTVYVGSDDGNVYAISASSGVENWQFDAGSEVRSSPAVVDGSAGLTVYVGTQDGTVYAIDAAEGTERWTFETGGAVMSSPTVVDGVVYVGSNDQSVYALDAGNGEELWAFETGFWVESSPAVVDGTVYVGSDDGSVYALDAGNGEEQWQVSTGDRVPGSPAVVDGVVYAGSQNGLVYALDAGNGEELWTFDAGRPVVSSPAVAGSTVYVGSRNHRLYALDAEDGDQLWSFDTGRQITAPPAVAVGGDAGNGSSDSSDGGVVYVGSESHSVFGLDAGTGDQLWSFDTGQPVSGGPAVVDGSLYVGSHNRTVYRLEDEFAVPGTDGDDSETPAGDDSGGESGGGIGDYLFLLLPATLLGILALVAGAVYAVQRAGLLEPVETASETHGESEAGTHETGTTDDAATDPADSVAGDGAAGADSAADSEPAADDTAGVPTDRTAGESQLWEAVVGDVIARAPESTKTATQDVLVTTYLDRDTLASPVVAYEIESLRSKPARVRLVEELVDADADSQPLGDGWTVEGDRLVYENVVDAGETVTTLVGRRDCPADRADALLDKPDVQVEEL